MKFLLTAINSKYIHSNLAVYSLKAYAKEYKEQVEIAEYTINNYEEEILKDLYLRNPDIIGFSCYIWNIEMVLRLSKEVVKVLPGVKIWLGGPEVSYYAKSYLQQAKAITGIMCGEGEETFLTLLKYYSLGDRTLNQIDGIVYRENGQIKENRMQTILSMDKLKFVYENPSDWENKIIYYETSRGCPFRCAYCLSSIEKGLRFRSLDLVFKELDWFLNAKVAQVKFVDRTFNCNKNHALSIWSYLAQHDNGITNFHFEISADLLDNEALEVFKTMRAGLIQLEIGVQSIQEETIKCIGRKMNLTKVSQMTKAVNALGNIHQHLDLIAGLPYETYEMFKTSYDWVYEQAPNQLQLGFLKLLKGTPMYEIAENYGIVSGDFSPYEVLFTKWISYHEILKLKAVEEMTEIYYNSGQYYWTLLWAVKKEVSSFSFFEELSRYYQNLGFDNKGSSRLTKYEILYDFLVKEKGYDEIEVGSLLTYDYCLREKMKKILPFAPKDSFQKEKADFFANEAKVFQYFKKTKGSSYRFLVNSSEAVVFPFEPVVFASRDEKTIDECFIVFDYSRRSPLDHNAMVYIIGKINGEDVNEE